MILNLILDGRIDLAVMLIAAIIISLTFHEYGHARVAKFYGDNTAESLGRLTLNPIPHIDPLGLLMVAMVGFGYAKPVPINPRNFNSASGELWVAAAGPAMNLLLAILFVNLFVAAQIYQIDWLTGPGQLFFFKYMAFINLILMLFNLIPIGPLDGHYILPYFLTPKHAYHYNRWNAQYGTMALLAFIGLSILGVPVFSFLMAMAEYISQFLVIF